MRTFIGYFFYSLPFIIVFGIMGSYHPGALLISVTATALLLLLVRGCVWIGNKFL